MQNCFFSSCSSSIEEFEDTKEVIRIRKSKKNRQHNGQKKKDKQRATKHTHKSKDRVTRTPRKTGGELSAPEGSLDVQNVHGSITEQNDVVV